jgi:flavin reductase (DIM6/NTAB) family NADH-FMN oxidoreductase RutF
MSIAKKTKKLLMNLFLGSVRPAQKFFIGQEEPQREITVWLHGMDAQLDVTSHHSMACASPFTICVAFEKGALPAEQKLKDLSLHFCASDASHRLLGRIGLKYNGISLPTSGPVLYFFEVSSVRNYCLPLMHLWTFHLQLSYRNWRNPVPSKTITLRPLDLQAMNVLFICPRPIGLASAEEDSCRNMFPMNVMGQLDDGYIGFGLQGARAPSHLVGRTGRIALSAIPMQQGDLGYKLGPNHSKKNGIDWNDLPFATKRSPKFGIPIPEFALRVREMEVESTRVLGSHTFFVGRVVGDERFAEGEEWCVIHGHYQAWRLRSRPSEIESSIAEDARVKRGLAIETGLI